MRQAMSYQKEDFERDWNAALALSQLLAVEETDARLQLLESTMMRIQAYTANNEYALTEMLAKEACDGVE
jgi:hypothetical protein